MLSARSWYCYVRQVCVPYAQVVVQRGTPARIAGADMGDAKVTHPLCQ